MTKAIQTSVSMILAVVLLAACHPPKSRSALKADADKSQSPNPGESLNRCALSPTALPADACLPAEVKGVFHEADSSQHIVDCGGEVYERYSSERYQEAYRSQLFCVKGGVFLKFCKGEFPSALSQARIDELKYSLKQMAEATSIVSMSCEEQLEFLNAEHNVHFNGEYLADISVIRGLDIQKIEVHIPKPTAGSNQSTARLHDLNPFYGMKNLNYINIKNNAVSDISALARLKDSLNTLDMPGNQIVDISVLNAFSALQKISLSDNGITKLPDLSASKRLSTVDIKNNQIRDISLLSGWSAKGTLRLDGNQIRNLPDLSGKTFAELQLSNNPLHDIAGLRGAAISKLILSLVPAAEGPIDLSPLKQVVTSNLDLNYAQFQASDVAFLPPNLKTLNIKTTDLRDIKGLLGLSALQDLSLDFSRSSIKDLSFLSTLALLKFLNLSETAVVDLKPLRGLTALQSLILSQSTIQNLEGLESLKKLQFINLSSTPVKDLGPLANLIKLNGLDISSTPVVDLRPLGSLPSLQSFTARDIELGRSIAKSPDNCPTGADVTEVIDAFCK